MKHNNKAFTLIELLVVVLIIGILSAIAIPQYQKAVYRARNTKLKNYVTAIATAQQSYYLANGKFAADFKDLDIDLPFAAPGTRPNVNIQPCNKVVPGTDSLREGENIHVFFNNFSTGLSSSIAVVALYTTGPYKCAGIGRLLGTQSKNISPSFCVEYADPSFVTTGDFCKKVEKGELTYTDPWGSRYYSLD